MEITARNFSPQKYTMIYSIDFVRFEKIDMNTRFINFIIERRGGKREK